MKQKSSNRNFSVFFSIFHKINQNNNCPRCLNTLLKFVKGDIVQNKNKFNAYAVNLYSAFSNIVFCNKTTIIGIEKRSRLALSK